MTDDEREARDAAEKDAWIAEQIADAPPITEAALDRLRPLLLPAQRRAA